MTIRTRRIGLALMAGALLVVGVAIARTTVTPFTLTETLIQTVDQGQWSSLPGGNIHVRNRVNDYFDDASDPRVKGPVRATTNANLDSNWTGPAWGAYHAENGEGVWDGIWHGNFNFLTGSGDYDAVGIGSGAFKGLQTMEHCVYVNLVGTCTGRILDTNAK